MTRGRLVVHAHFYQPLRADPFTGIIPREPSAAPFHDWDERVNAECYRPNAERRNLDRLSYDVGPTLAAWLERADPATHRRFIEADHPTQVDGAHGNAMAQAFHHTILPLASLADRRTEIRWGIRDFEVRFGRRPEGMWLPETAVDLPTLRLLAGHGIRYTILAPWQSADPSLDTRHPYHVNLGGGRTIAVVFYDGALSGAVSFDPAATADADTFIRDRLIPRFGMAAAEQEALRSTLATPRRGDGPAHQPDATASLATDRTPLVVIATDGELYGHHQKFRDLFLHRLLYGAEGPAGQTGADRGFDVVTLSRLLAEEGADTFHVARIAERTSWSCHHGVARWSAECPDAADGRWKGPLRAALDRTAAAMDAVTIDVLRREARSVVAAEARDAYVDVVIGVSTREAFVARWLGRRASAATGDRFLDLMEAQRWRLAMFQSDAWFWDDPVRSETRQVLRAAARAVRLLDGVAGTRLEASLRDDLTLFTSPSRGVDGFAIYREALAEIGQPQ